MTRWLQLAQAVSYGAAAVAAVVAVGRYVTDTAAARRASQETAVRKAEEVAARQEANRAASRDLEWRKATTALDMVDDMEKDRLAADAMLMLDYDGRTYRDGDAHWTLSREDINRSLRSEGDRLSDMEVFVRDAFDHLFWHFERVQHAINIELISLPHVSFPIGYHAARIGEHDHVFRSFLGTYGYHGAQKLIDDLNTEEARLVGEGNPPETGRPFPPAGRPDGLMAPGAGPSGALRDR